MIAGTLLPDDIRRHVVLGRRVRIAKQHERFGLDGLGLVGDDGEVTDASTEEFLTNFMHEYARFVERVLTVLPRED